MTLTLTPVLCDVANATDLVPAHARLRFQPLGVTAEGQTVILEDPVEAEAGATIHLADTQEMAPIRSYAVTATWYSAATGKIMTQRLPAIQPTGATTVALSALLSIAPTEPVPESVLAQCTALAAAAAASAAAAAGAAAEAGWPYPTKAAFLAATVPATAVTVSVLGDGQVLRYVRDAAGATVQADGTHWRLAGPGVYPSVAAMQAGTYAFDPGDRISAEGHSYIVADTVSATTIDGPGGTHLTVLPDERGYLSVTAFGADPTGTVLSDAAIAKCIEAAGADGAWEMPFGVYLTQDDVAPLKGQVIWFNAPTITSTLRLSVVELKITGEVIIDGSLRPDGRPVWFGTLTTRGQRPSAATFRARHCVVGHAVGGASGAQVVTLRNSYYSEFCAVGFSSSILPSSVPMGLHPGAASIPLPYVAAGDEGNGEYLPGVWVGHAVGGTGTDLLIGIEVDEAGQIVDWRVLCGGGGYSKGGFTVTLDTADLWKDLDSPAMGGTGSGWTLTVPVIQERSPDFEGEDLTPDNGAPEWVNDNSIGAIWVSAFHLAGVVIYGMNYSAIDQISCEGGRARGRSPVRGQMNGARINSLFVAPNANPLASPGPGQPMVNFEIPGVNSSSITVVYANVVNQHVTQDAARSAQGRGWAGPCDLLARGISVVQGQFRMAGTSDLNVTQFATLEISPPGTVTTPRGVVFGSKRSFNDGDVVGFLGAVSSDGNNPTRGDGPVRMVKIVADGAAGRLGGKLCAGRLRQPAVSGVEVEPPQMFDALLWDRSGVTLGVPLRLNGRPAGATLTVEKTGVNPTNLTPGSSWSTTISVPGVRAGTPVASVTHSGGLLQWTGEFLADDVLTVTGTNVDAVNRNEPDGFVTAVIDCGQIHHGRRAEVAATPPAIADGAEDDLVVTVPGVRPGDPVQAAFVVAGSDVGLVALHARVTAADQVTVRLKNVSGAAGGGTAGTLTVAAF